MAHPFALGARWIAHVHAAIRPTGARVALACTDFTVACATSAAVLGAFEAGTGRAERIFVAVAFAFCVAFAAPTASAIFAGARFNTASRALPALVAFADAIIAISLAAAVLAAGSSRAIGERLPPWFTEARTHAVVAQAIATAVVGA